MVITLDIILEKLFESPHPSSAMTHNVTPCRIYLHRKGIWFLLTQPRALSPRGCIPRKMMTWSLETHLSAVVLRLFIGVLHVGRWVCACVCVLSDPKGRRIICRNCFPAEALLTDRHLRYGSWTVLYQAFPPMDWQLNVSSHRLSVGSPVGLRLAGCAIPVCQWEM